MAIKGKDEKNQAAQDRLGMIKEKRLQAINAIN